MKITIDAEIYDQIQHLMEYYNLTQDQVVTRLMLTGMKQMDIWQIYKKTEEE